MLGLTRPSGAEATTPRWVSRVQVVLAVALVVVMFLLPASTPLRTAAGLLVLLLMVLLFVLEGRHRLRGR
jgi:hypothetical protein